MRIKDFSGNWKPGLQADPSVSPITVKGRTKLVSGWLGADVLRSGAFSTLTCRWRLPADCSLAGALLRKTLGALEAPRGT